MTREGAGQNEECCESDGDQLLAGAEPLFVEDGVQGWEAESLAEFLKELSECEFGERFPF